ncbi:MAG: SUMF1/EgtB/PvdO family nonheme iron enzyme [Myxococcota bacterium]
MGLHEYYTPAKVSTLQKSIAELRFESLPALMAIVEDRDAAVKRRFAAGTLLALLGDPRIDVLEPRMVDIPGGVATIGLRPDQVDDVVQRYEDLGVRREWIEKECPAHQVELPSFRIGKYPVTNLEYRRFLEETRFGELPTAWSLGTFPVVQANHPVYTVSATAADAYARWLSEKTGRNFRLPSEAEWEYAAAGAEQREFPWGDAFDEARTNTVETGLMQTTPVGMFSKGDTPQGVSDLGGNVEEYVLDSYRAYPGGAVVQDDLHDINSAYRVCRGGSFARFADLTRCRRRHGFVDSPIYAIGFRLVEEVSNGRR